VSVENQRLHQRRVERQLLQEEERIRAEGEQLQREHAVLAAADVELSIYRQRQTERGMFTRCALSCVFVIVTLCMRVDVQCMLRYHSLKLYQTIFNLHTLNTLYLAHNTHTHTHTHTHKASAAQHSSTSGCFSQLYAEPRAVSPLNFPRADARAQRVYPW
jgi:hypothetical protein